MLKIEEITLHIIWCMYFVLTSNLKFQEMPAAFSGRQLFRTRWLSLLRVLLPWDAGCPMRRLRETHLRTLHHRHVQKVSPRAFRLLILSQATQQRHLQRARRQALLSRLLRQIIRVKRTNNRSFLMYKQIFNFEGWYLSSRSNRKIKYFLIYLFRSMSKSEGFRSKFFSYLIIIFKN